MIKKALVFSLATIILLAAPVLAVVSYRAPYTITGSDSGYSMLPVIGLADNQWMADNGFMSSSALDTRIETLGGLEKPHLVTDEKTLTAVPLAALSQVNLYFTTGNSDLSAMDVIVGYGGYITVADHADLDMEDSFLWDIKGWVNTDAGATKNLVYREDSFRIYISAEDSIRAAILSAGDVEDLAVTATGITSGVRRVVVETDGVDFTISVYDADDILIDDATTPLGANSVPDSGNSYVLMQTNCMAYAEYIKLSVSE